MVVSVLEITAHSTVPTNTLLSIVVEEKPVPVIVIKVPPFTDPVVGVMSVISPLVTS